MSAALLMAVTTTALRDEVLRSDSAATVLNELNERLLPRTKQTNMNSALVMSVFDPTTNTVDIANAGMVQPYLGNGHGWESVPVGGYPLGASGRANYKAKTRTLTPGTTILYISDGVVECQNAQRELFGFERFEQLIGGFGPTITPEQMVETIIKAVYSYLDNEEPQDDITVVVFQIEASSVPA